MIKFLKKLFRKRYASNYYDLINFYCQRDTKYNDSFYKFKNIYILYSNLYNELYLRGEDDKAILVCRVTPVKHTTSAGPFSMTETIGADFDWNCGWSEQKEIYKILDEMDEYLSNKEKERKERERIEKEKERKNKEIRKILSR